MLQVTNLGFDYSQSPLLKQVDFNVPMGKLLHLRGKNGSGKTTLLKLIAGLFLPSEGGIYFQGKPIEQNKANYHRNLCYIGHKPGINHALTLRENCHFDLQRRRRQSIDWMQLMKALSLTGLEDTLCGRLSAGQRRRVALIRLCLSDAKLWLLDEPFVALDVSAIAILTQMLHQHLSSGGGVIMTSHQPIQLSPEMYLEYVL